jgi:hypothetical protein
MGVMGASSAKFLEYARRCEELAEQADSSADRAQPLKMRDRFMLSASQIDKSRLLIAESKALLARVAQQYPDA